MVNYMVHLQSISMVLTLSVQYFQLVLYDFHLIWEQILPLQWLTRQEFLQLPQLNQEGQLPKDTE